jgi:hypothetical protein
MDVWDHAVADDLKQAATIMTAFVWHTAQRDAPLPRRPEPEPAARGREVAAPPARGDRDR